MSQSPTAAVRTRAGERRTEEFTVTPSENEASDIFAALDDEQCRHILETATDEAVTASEVAEACDVPLSTVYRKLDLLTDAGLLSEGTRMRRSGKHATEYTARIDELTVAVDADGDIQLTMTPTEDATNRPRASVLGNW